jgi:hypothetical protein
VCLTVKPVGEPDAGDRRVRFDERGWETERWPLAPSYRAHPRLYLHVAFWHGHVRFDFDGGLKVFDANDPELTPMR